MKCSLGWFYSGFFYSGFITAAFVCCVCAIITILGDAGIVTECQEVPRGASPPVSLLKLERKEELSGSRTEDAHTLHLQQPQKYAAKSLSRWLT